MTTESHGCAVLASGTSNNLDSKKRKNKTKPEIFYAYNALLF